MEKLSTHFHNKNMFRDVSGEPFDFAYPETQMVGDHLFVHVCMGIYRAEPEFEETKENLIKLCMEYEHLVFRCKKREWECDEDGELSDSLESAKCTVYFAYNSECCKLDDCGVFNTFRHLDRHPEFRGLSEKFDWEKFDGSEVFYEGEDCRARAAAGSPGKNGGKAAAKELMQYRWDHWPGGDGAVRDKIRLDGYIGYLVEEGIYYFGMPKEMELLCNGRSEPVVDMNCFQEDAAALCYSTDFFHPTPFIGIRFLTLDKRYYPRLMELCEQQNAVGGHLFYTEFHKSRQEEEDSFLKRLEADGIQVTEKEDGIWTIGGIDEKEDGKKADEPQFLPEEDAEELLEGAGIRNLEVSYKAAFFPMRDFHKYDYAYKLKDELVLVTLWGGAVERETHSMLFMEKLVVGETRLLSCGVEYTVFHEVIHAEDKYRELLTEEAYALYREEALKSGVVLDP